MRVILARFILISPVYGDRPTHRLGTIADSAGNAQPNDVVWPWLCAQAGWGSALSPLDATGSAQTGQPISTGATTSTGGASLDAGL
jgi:hypothetical protein